MFRSRMISTIGSSVVEVVSTLTEIVVKTADAVKGRTGEGDCGHRGRLRGTEGFPLHLSPLLRTQILVSVHIGSEFGTRYEWLLHFEINGALLSWESRGWRGSLGAVPAWEVAREVGGTYRGGGTVAAEAASIRSRGGQLDTRAVNR